MVQYQPELDRAFAALADSTRRRILQRLGQSSATVTELAEPFGMSLTGLKKHLQVLEEVGLVNTQKVGRTRVCNLGPRRLDDVQQWIEAYRGMLEERLDRLGELLESTTDAAAAHGEPQRPARGEPRTTTTDE
jgi:DNA-binding transcriptional ArsR family regulator